MKTGLRLLAYAVALVLTVVLTADVETVAFTVMDGRVVVELVSCCTRPSTGKINPEWAPDPANSGEWMPVVDPDGAAYPAGHKHDAYFTGKKAPAKPAGPSKRYVYAEDAPLSVKLADRFVGLKYVSFPQFDADPDGSLTPKGLDEVKASLKRIYGDDAFIKKIGEGGFQVVFLVFPKKGRKVVAKVRKIPPTLSLPVRKQNIDNAIWDMRRDLAMEVIAVGAVRRATYRLADGTPAPFLVDGKPARLTNGPPVALARVASITNTALLARGIVQQELVSFRASKPFKAYMKEDPEKPDGWRQRAVKLAEQATDANADDVATFLDKFYKPSKFGPDVIKIHAWLQGCRKYRRFPTIATMCRLARVSYNIPDDFDDRLRALEQLYRDTAGEVIRFHRHNFYDGSGNDAADGKVREVGIDYNHGRNAGWDAPAGQFALWDW